jgi:hypothetical protein
MFDYDFNPIQMGYDFTVWQEMEVESAVRRMVNELYVGFHGRSVPVERINLELKYLGLEYDSLPQSCKDMIDELDVIM